MRKKILASILALTMIFSLSNGINVKAQTLETGDENVVFDNGGQLEYVELSDEEVEPANISETEANVMERQYAGTFSVSDGIAAYSQNDEVTPNTDPNNAYVVSDNTAYQGTIVSANEMYWYAFVLENKSKVTIFTQMDEALDVDLYMFSLNTETAQLDLIGGSATEGKGLSEYYNTVLDAGTYFFAIGGYEGAGNFAFAYFQSSADANNEVNDTTATATDITFNNGLVGVIDNPFDIDYYKVSVTKPTIMKYSISSSNGYSLLYATKSGGSAAIYSIGSGANTVKIMPGTYYFAVISENDTYSSSSTYTINFNKVAEMSSDSSANIIGLSENAGIVFQTNSSGSVCYVNGNEIDISYSYVQNLSNSAGSQSYNIAIQDRDDVYAYIGDGVYEPSAVYYHNSTRPAMHVSGRSALELTYYSDSNFYSIHCRCTGAYSMNNLWQDFKVVTVLIDPGTGKLIDIVEYNYYYDFAPVGSNSITITRPYSMTFYSN